MEWEAGTERQTVELRSLAAKLSEAEQRERQRLAKILHDDVQQTLLAARIKLGRIFQRPLQTDEAQRLERVSELLTEALSRTRALAVELQPPVLRYGNLVDALQWLARRNFDQHGLAVALEVTGSPIPVDEPTRIVLFETVRELLLNVVKHAGVQEAQVRVSYEPTRVTLCVEDYGMGIFRRSSRSSQSGRRSRVDQLQGTCSGLGGSFSLRSTPGSGTCCAVRLRLNSSCSVLRGRQVAAHSPSQKVLASLLLGHQVFEVAEEAFPGAAACWFARWDFPCDGPK